MTLIVCTHTQANPNTVMPASYAPSSGGLENTILLSERSRSYTVLLF